MADQTASIEGQFEDGISSPLTGVVNLFSRLEGGLERLSTKLAPLTSRATALVTALGAGKLFSGSIEAAEKEVEAEAVLLNALRGRREELERIDEGIRSITETSTAGRDDLVRLAATFANAGLAASLIPDALRASVQAAEALNKPVEAIANEIIKVQSGRAGRLGSQIPELKELIELGGSAADVIQLLNERFAGTAEAVARTPFGRVAQGLRDIEDVAQDLGRELVRIKAAAVDALLSDLQQLRSGLSSDGFQAMLNVVIQLLPYLIRVAEVLIAITAGAQVARLVQYFVSLLGPVLTVATSLAGILAALTAIAVVFEALVGDSDEYAVSVEAASSAYQTAKDEAESLFQKVAQGQLTIENIFDLILTRIQNVGIFLRGFLVAPIFNYIIGIRDFALGAISFFWEGSKLGAINVIDFLQRRLLDLIRLLGGALDTVINGAIEGLNFLPGVAIEFRSNLGGSVPEVFVDLGAAAEEAAKKTTAATRVMTEAFPEAARQTAEDVQLALDEIYENNVALGERLDRATAENTAKRRAERDAELAEELRRRQRLATELAGQQRALEQASRGSVEANPALKLQLLQEQLVAQDGVVAASRAEVELATEKRDLTIQSLAAHEQTAETVRAENDATAEVNQATQGLLTAERDRARVLAEISQAKKEQQDIDRRSAESLVAGTSAARRIAVEQLQRNQQDRASGFISLEDKLASDAEAIDAFRRKAVEARAAVEAIIAQLPPEEADKIRLQLQAIGDDIQPDQDRGFFTGIADGVRGAAAEVDNLGRVGAQVGQVLTNDIGGNLRRVFQEGSDAAKEWGITVLTQIADILVQMLVLKAVEFGVGKIGFASGGLVPGSRTGYDSVDARLTPGEYVHPTASVDYYGHGVMRGIKDMTIPRELFGGVREQGSRSSPSFGRFADGGPVRSTPSVGAVRAATIVASEQEMDRLLAGGGVAMDRYLDRKGYRRHR